MNINEDGKKFIKFWEGLQLAAYKDGGGVWTIGYGHTEDVKPGMLISKHQAEVMFDYDIAKYEQAVENALPSCPGQNQFNALVSLCYNIGTKAFRGSTLVGLWKHGPLVVAPQFNRWIFDNGRVVPGLVKRRFAEREMFLKGDS